jgi:hypothetical protein
LGLRTLPEPLTLKRLAAARFVFIFGMVLRDPGRAGERGLMNEGLAFVKLASP